MERVDRQWPCAEGHNLLTPDLVKIPLMGVQVCSPWMRNWWKMQSMTDSILVIRLKANPSDWQHLTTMRFWIKKIHTHTHTLTHTYSLSLSPDPLPSLPLSLPFTQISLFYACFRDRPICKLFYKTTDGCDWEKWEPWILTNYLATSNDFYFVGKFWKKIWWSVCHMQWKKDFPTENEMTKLWFFFIWEGDGGGPTPPQSSLFFVC